MATKWLAAPPALRRLAALGLGFLALTLLLRAAPPASAADAPAPDSARGTPGPDERDASTPAGAMRRYLDAARAGRYRDAAAWLDLGDLPGRERSPDAPEIARRLAIVLEQKLWIDPETLGHSPEGESGDELPPELDRVGTIDTPRGPVDILLERVRDGYGRQSWRIASSTVDKVPELYDLYGYGPLGKLLPAPLFKMRLLDVGLWQWIGLALFLVAAVVASWILLWILVRAARPFVSRTRTHLDDQIVELISTPLRWALALASFAGMVFLLRLTPAVRGFVYGLLEALAILVVTWIGLRVIDVVAALVRARLERDGRRSVVSIVPLGRRATKVFLVLMAFVFALQNLGFNVTGLIAGLGVGGLAVALAAQKTLENFFGGISLVSDRPVRVGDFCAYADGRMGTIEEIGLRSTRVRTLDRTIVSIPNADFAQRALENYNERDRLRLFATLALRYDTTPDQLRWILAELRKVLLAHPRVLADPARVRFVNFGAHSLDLEVFAYVDTTDGEEFLGIREDVFLRFMDVVAAGGSRFAYPSQTVYLGRDAGIDAERRARAERAVEDWRGTGELPFPDFTPEMVERIDDSLDFPPRGSARAQQGR